MAGGCPGLPQTLTSIVTLGTFDIAAGYPTPTLVNTSSVSSLGAMGVYHNDAYDVNGSDLNSALEGGGGSCSCCCSEMMSGPTFMHMWNEGQDGPQAMEDGAWASRDYWPGGSSGIYMNMMDDKTYHFNVGQREPCEEIRGGLYSFRDSDDVDCHKYVYDWSLGSSFHWDYISTHACGYVRGFTEPALRWALFEVTPNQTYINSSYGLGDFKIVADGGNPTGGFNYLSLCLPCQAITDTTCGASCANAQHYGHQIPSVPPTGPGYIQEPYVGSLFEAENCDVDPCSPNGMCFGPGGPAGPGPTACLSSNSPLDGSGDGGADEDNVCFDCNLTPIFHPCYDVGNPQTANNGGGPNGNTNLAAAPLYQCNNIYVPGLDSDGLPLAGSSAYNSTNGGPDLWAEQTNVVQDLDSWDSCCLYRTIGCVDSNFANFNAIARSNGFDCIGNPDPNDEYTYYDPNWFGTGNGAVVCQNVPTLPTGSNFNTNNPPDEYTNPAVDIACIDPSMIGNNGQPFHPLGWSNTNAFFTNTDCCTNDGCMDDGSGGAIWTSDPGNTLPWTGPGPYYPGYDVLIGVIPTQIQVTQSPIAATNFTYAFTNDCSGVLGGTDFTCCEYVIPGCGSMSYLTDGTTAVGAGPNPDIFGNGGYNVWNYNPYVTIDDGSCFEEQPIGGCIDDGGLGLSTVLVPPFSPIYPGIPANNFNPIANIADNSCTWDEGCPDPYANNYDPCVINPVTPPCGLSYPVIPNPALCNYDIAGSGPGCMDPQALNYNPLSTEDCVGNQPPTVFSCCVYPVEGCTDYNATNYDPLAVNDDGSCEYDISTTQEGVNWLYGTTVLLCRDPLTKEEVLMGVCDQPEIQSEIFIERGKQSVMEPNLRLGEITTMGGLINHGYKYFRIKKQ